MKCHRAVIFSSWPKIDLFFALELYFALIATNANQKPWKFAPI